MNRYLLVIVLVFATVAGAWAKGLGGVAFTKHDFSAVHYEADKTFPYASTTEPEICIFCHTPHGGKLNTQLWNRTDTASTFTHYVSATLGPSRLNVSATRPVNAESLLCLSCHDGTVAMNSLLNYSNSVGNPNNVATMITLWTEPSGNVGAHRVDQGGGYFEYEGNTFLSDDHPISFSYFNVYNYNDGFSDINKPKLRSVDEAKGRGVRFFGADGSNGSRVECSTCHDPHVDYISQPEYTSFLITPNTGSALCLACHQK